MTELFALIVSIFLTGPIQSELSEKLAAARAPQAVIAHVADCARDAAPALLQRASADPWWAATSTLAIWAGYARPDAVLVEAAPACRPAVEAARPFLDPGA